MVERRTPNGEVLGLIAKGIIVLRALAGYINSLQYWLKCWLRPNMTENC